MENASFDWTDASAWSSAVGNWGQTIQSGAGAIDGVLQAVGGIGGGQDPVPLTAGPVASNPVPMPEQGAGFFSKLAAKLGLPVWSAVTIVVSGIVLVVVVLIKLIKK